MSLGAAFNNASSGLTVALRAVGVTSSNLANALTENYGKRDVTIASRIEGGARITGINRLVDQRVQGQLWLSIAQSAGQDRMLENLGEMDRLIGTTNDPMSLYELTTRFETSLISLASRPNDPLRQEVANSAAQELATKFQEIGSGLQDIRTRTEKQISRTVSQLNNHLSGVEELNGNIAKSHGFNTAGLEDERQAIIDKLSRIIPVKLVDRDHGRIALMTPKGQFLLDQSAAEITFDARGLVTDSHSVENGSLDIPTLNGGVLHLPDYGELQALLDIRDNVTQGLHAEITGLANSLVTRLSSSSSGDPLFTFTSNVPNASDITLTGDLALAEPSAVLAALNNGGSTFASQTFHISSNLSVRILDSETLLSSSVSKQSALQELKSIDGVDTDTELQNLIRIEKIYTANAKTLQVVGNMLDDLLKIG